VGIVKFNLKLNKMKKRYAFILIAFLAIVSSCEKDPIISTADRVGISKVTYYPILTLTGDRIMVVEQGGTFTDPGATAKAGTADVPVVATGSVNTSVADTYTITYTATNQDGFSVTAYRTIVVYDTDAGAAAQDLSGSYLRAATGELSTWTKIAPGVYTVLNPGGAAAGENLLVVAVNPTGFTIAVQSQYASDGTLSVTSGEVYRNSIPASYDWHFLNPGYGTQLRTFVKQ